MTNNLSKQGTISSDPALVAGVHNREDYIALALGKMAVPLDQVTASAMLNMALNIYAACGHDGKWLCTMMREWADTIELHNAPVQGKPS